MEEEQANKSNETKPKARYLRIFLLAASCLTLLIDFFIIVANGGGLANFFTDPFNLGWGVIAILFPVLSSLAIALVSFLVALLLKRKKVFLVTFQISFIAISILGPPMPLHVDPKVTVSGNIVRVSNGLLIEMGGAPEQKPSTPQLASGNIYVYQNQDSVQSVTIGLVSKGHMSAEQVKATLDATIRGVTNDPRYTILSREDSDSTLMAKSRVKMSFKSGDTEVSANFMFVVYQGCVIVTELISLSSKNDERFLDKIDIDLTLIST